MSNNKCSRGETKGKSKKEENKSSTSGTTRISAKIDEIAREGKAEVARVHEKNVDPQEEKYSDRDFELKLNIKEVKGSISLADIIKEKTSGGQKKWKIL